MLVFSAVPAICLRLHRCSLSKRLYINLEGAQGQVLLDFGLFVSIIAL